MAIKNCAESSVGCLWTDEKRLIRFNNQLLRPLFFQDTISPDLLKEFIRSIRSKVRNINNRNNTTTDKSLVKNLEYADYIKAIFAFFNLWNNEPDKIKMALYIVFGLQARVI
jgi:hypothetical protein